MKNPKPESLVLAMGELRRAKQRILGKPVDPYPKGINPEALCICLDAAYEDLKESALSYGDAS